MADRPMHRPPDAPTAPRPPGRRFPVVVIVVGVIVAAAIVALLSSAKTTKKVVEPPGVEQTRAVQITGAPLPRLGDGGDDIAIGRKAPVLKGESFDGAPVAIVAGKPKVLMFVAHWCPHCQREVPVIATWLRDNGPPVGVDLYAIATATKPDKGNYPPSAWLRRERFTVPTLADDDQYRAGRAFGLSAYPFFVAVDADQKVVARADGELSTDQLRALLDKARKGAGAA